MVDPGVIAELRGLQSTTDPDFFNHLNDLFIEETPWRLAAIRGRLRSQTQKRLRTTLTRRREAARIWARLGSMRCARFSRSKAAPDLSTERPRCCRCWGKNSVASERLSKRKRTHWPRIRCCQMRSTGEIKILLDNVTVIAVIWDPSLMPVP